MGAAIRKIGEEWVGFWGERSEYRLTFRQLANGRSAEMYSWDLRCVVHREVIVGDFQFCWNFDKWRKAQMAFIEKALAKAKAQTPGRKASDVALSRSMPALYEFLTCEEVDGRKRETSKLSIRWASGRFQGYLNDVDSKQSLFATGDTFQGLLAALEEQLKSEDPGWRDMPDWESKKKPKKP